MSMQLRVGLLWTLLLAWQAGVSETKSIDHSELLLHVFTNLQTQRIGDSLPPFPEGIKLELTCQAAARKTFWFERHPPNEYPDLEKGKLDTKHINSVPGLNQEVYTIPSLKQEDDGRELWCTMDSSTTKSIVKLNVVGRPSASSISYDKTTHGLELTCSTDSLHPHLELCWYRDAETLYCRGPEGEDASPVTVITSVPDDDLLMDPKLACKVLFKQDEVLATLTPDARRYYHGMLEEASVTLLMEVGDSGPCADYNPTAKSPTTKTVTMTDPDNIICRELIIKEERVTTPAPTTTTTATTATPKLKEKKEATAATAPPAVETNNILLTVLYSVSGIAGTLLVVLVIVLGLMRRRNIASSSNEHMNDEQ